MKRLRRFVLLGFVLMICSVCLAGCMRLESTFRINKNGTVDIFSVMYNEANELLIDPVKAAVIGYGEGTVSKKMDEETTIFTF